MGKVSIYAIACSIAFCSIVYELLLGQMLSAYLGNTILRYSVTIGLYLSSMGFGALLYERLRGDSPSRQLAIVEAILTVLGAGSLFLIGWIDSLCPPTIVVSGVAHGIILLIGLFSGLELPLLIQIREREGVEEENRLLGINYTGAFAGTMFFALFGYPCLGLVQTAVLTASLNALSSIFLILRGQRIPGTPPLMQNTLFWLQGTLLCATMVMSIFSESLRDHLVAQFIRQSL